MIHVLVSIFYAVWGTFVFFGAMICFAFALIIALTLLQFLYRTHLKRSRPDADEHL